MVYRKLPYIAAALVACVMVMPVTSHAQAILSDDFTGATTANNAIPWYYYNGACLTAGTSTGGTNPGTIPSCISIASSYYNEILVGGYKGYLGSSTAPSGPSSGVADPAGHGALRFTNGYPNGYHQNGAILSQDTYPTGSGLQVTFKTVTYRGDSGGGAGDGADGISFFLMDGSMPPGIGAWGGSLGYSCSNTNPPYNGLVGAYLGLGIDEYGNFLNQGDNTATGYNYVPGRIGLRGAGNISWPWLALTYPALYPSTWTSSQQQSAVQNTCASGVLEDYNGNKLTYNGTRPYSVMDYPAISNAYKVLPSSSIIANESATQRSQATPIAYKLKITQDGLLSLSYSYNGGAYISVLSKQNITASNGALPSSFRFGFAGSTGGSSNIHEVLCFQAAPADQATTSVGINAKEAAKIASGTQAYLAYYYPSNWTGRLTANDLLFDPTTQIVSVSATSNWDAQCVLTGVAAGKSCPTTGAMGPVAAETPASRSILSWNGSAGVSFEWSSLTSAQQKALDQGDSSPINSNRLSYLRGDRSNEVNSSGVGLFRARDSVLADIVDSSPTWVGPPSLPYATTWSDRLHSSASAPENTATQSYAQFASTMATRLNVVYAGANDGMLHGFRAGSYDSSGNYVNDSTTPNDGEEVLAYFPGAVLQSAVSGCTPTSTNPTDSAVQSIHGVVPANPSTCSPSTSTTVDPSVDYSSTQYGHNFTVDGTPGTGDLFYGGSWHTWLAGGLGPGGAALYVLDVTNPANFSEGNAGSLVIGEWTSSTISCSGNATCGTNLGDTYGQPVIRRLHNGMWAVIFGNGFGSSSGDAGIFIMTVDPTTGTKTFYYLSTGQSGTSDGIAYVAPVDLDRDRIIDYVYAGDLNGHVWRFDLTSADPASWAASPTPLFTTPSGQPITTKLITVIMPSTPQRLMIDFGTGQRTPITNSTPVTYASGTQYLYGVWDWNMSSWNSQSAVQYMSLAAPQSVVASGAGQNLVTQTATIQSGGELDGSSNPVCWKGLTTCSGGASANADFGWVLALPDSKEQVVYNPILYQGAFVVNTTIPAANSLTSCTTNTDTGNTIAISAAQGGKIPDFFQNYHDAVGFQTNGSGSAFVVNAGGLNHLLTQTTNLGSNGAVTTKGPFTCQNGACDSAIHPQGPVGRRLTWAEKR